MSQIELQTDPRTRDDDQLVRQLAAPDHITNCPECSLWLPEGALACPECETVVYGRYLHRLAEIALQREQASEWTAARAVWQQELTWLPAGTKQAGAVQDHIAQIDGRFRNQEDAKARWTKRLGPFAPIAFFLLKAKTFLFAILKFKFLFSFLAFFGVYWALFGWRFGLGFTLAILIHELGHYVAARRRGLKADLPLFIPGMGAYVRWYHEGVSVETLTAISLSGPLFGLFVALAFLGIASRIDSPLFLALAYAAAFLNLFNLVPVLGLDGAQATYSLNRLQRFLIVLTCGFALCVSARVGLSGNRRRHGRGGPSPVSHQSSQAAGAWSLSRSSWSPLEPSCGPHRMPPVPAMGCTLANLTLRKRPPPVAERL